MLRTEADPDAEPRPDGYGGDPLPAGVLRHDGVRPLTHVAHDRPAHGTLSDPRQSRDSAEGQLPLPAETITVAEILKSAGYATACMGKWGMGMFHTSGSPMKKASTISSATTASATRTAISRDTSTTMIDGSSCP